MAKTLVGPLLRTFSPRAVFTGWLVLHAFCHAAPVAVPYTENFNSGTSSFTPAATVNTSWSHIGGKFRANVSSGGVPAAATIQAPAFDKGFVIESTIKVQPGGNAENTFGLGFLGSDATLTGNATAPYYLADVKPGTSAIRLVRIATNTDFLINNEQLSFTLDTAADFKISVEGAYENTSLRITITVTQGASFSQHVYEEEVPLAGTFFGLRTRTNTGSLQADYDDFTLRALTDVKFTGVPSGFAHPGLNYESVITSESSDGGNVTLTSEQLPTWLTFTPGANGSGTLSGTPPLGTTGTATVRLRASNDSGGSTVNEFTISLIGVSGVIISEFMASNGGPFLDEDGDESDWLEILNASPNPVDLGGWMLKDDKASWTIPAGVTLPAYGNLVIFASDKNRGSATTPLHLNFKLSTNANSYIALVRPDTSIASQYTYPVQRQGVSYGAWGDYSSIGYLLTPTPGTVNAAQGVIGFATDPSFSVLRGRFSSPQALTISSTLQGATLSYTLDGSLPTLTNGTLVPPPNPTTGPSVPLNIATTSVVRAVTLLEGYAPSTAITHTYLFPNDIIQQSANGSPPVGWPAGPIKSQVLDYGMDPDIVTPGDAQAVKDALASLPSFSLVTDRDHLFNADTGIYVNAYGREEAWERPTSLEMIKPDGTSAFQINCGMRMRGGASRAASNPKHSFHFYFRGEYGASHLEYPLFENQGAQEFDRIDLRSTQGKSWHHSGGSEATYMRDEWSRATQGEMGHAHTRSRFAHLYINGQYWGIFATQERADDAFAASYFGGEKEDYDVIKSYVLPHRVEAADGDALAWNDLHAKATAGFASDAAYLAIQGRDPNGQPSATIKPLVEIDNLIDYMILNMFTGNTDGPVNPNANVPKNFFCFRPRDGSVGFRFVAHDFEDTMNGTNVTGNTAVGSTLPYFNPRWLHLRLAQNANYRKRFADRVQKNLFNDGALASAKNVQRWNDMRAILAPAMIAESARWGDAKRAAPYKVSDWNTNCTSVANHLNARPNGLISQLRSTPVPPLFPSIDAPAFSQHGGIIVSGFQLSITSPNGTQIYYTTSGADPSDAGATLYLGPITLTSASVTVKARAKSGSDEWSALTEARFTFQPVPAAIGNLVISEVNYNPPLSVADPNDLSEFIELHNPSTSLVDLTGVRLATAVEFTFPSMLLGPNERIVVIKDATSFGAIHGSAPVVAGIWTGSLNQTGEAVILRAANGDEIERVTYSSGLPWPPAASNNGRSLVRVRPDLPADHPGSWRASMTDNGNPGGHDGVPLTGWLTTHGFADANAPSPGGLKALVHYATGISPTASTPPEIQITRNADHDVVTLRRSVASLDNVRFHIDQSPDLGSWPVSMDVDDAGTNNMTARINNSDGTETVSIKIPGIGSPRFYRVRYTTR